jgi:hypothetical protein
MESAKAALAARRKKRRENGVAAKNAPRIKAMFECAAPHLRRHRTTLMPILSCS